MSATPASIFVFAHYYYCTVVYSLFSLLFALLSKLPMVLRIAVDLACGSSKVPLRFLLVVDAAGIASEDELPTDVCLAAVLTLARRTSWTDVIRFNVGQNAKAP